MFITTNTLNRMRVFSNPAYAREAIETLYRVQELHPFFLYEFVIMPDHCHFLVKVPESGSVSKIMNVYKLGVAHNIGMGPIWQSRFHMILPEDPKFIRAYIQQNPVKAGLVEFADEYSWSSASGKWDTEEWLE